MITDQFTVINCYRDWPLLCSVTQITIRAFEEMKNMMFTHKYTECTHYTPVMWRNKKHFIKASTLQNTGMQLASVIYYGRRIWAEGQLYIGAKREGWQFSG